CPVTGTATARTTSACGDRARPCSRSGRPRPWPVRAPWSPRGSAAPA
ncbi:MAG: hypothetical protein AVDCRST_MAG47-222, partial [uncultured Nocardioidaceae bacterium]